jgi:hypothetical protein
MSEAKKTNARGKPKTLPDEVENCSLKAILNAYGGLISRDPSNAAKWLYGLKFAPDELAAFPTLGKLLTSKVIVANFAPSKKASAIKQEQVA